MSLAKEFSLYNMIKILHCALVRPIFLLIWDLRNTANGSAIFYSARISLTQILMVCEFYFLMSSSQLHSSYNDSYLRLFN